MAPSLHLKAKNPVSGTLCFLVIQNTGRWAVHHHSEPLESSGCSAAFLAVDQASESASTGDDERNGSD
jgi:hypothetical protein